MTFREFLILLALFGQNCFVSGWNNEYRIISGRKASTLEFPYIAEILRRSIHWCGGSIIHKYFILTAAHCMYFNNELSSPTLYSVIVGTDTKQTGESIYKVKEFIIHEQHNQKWAKDEYDIGLMKLTQPLEYSATVQPVALASKTPEHGEIGWVVGYGRTRPARAISAGHLMAVELPVVGLEQCRKIIPKVADDMICGGNENYPGDACQGDSGGPFVVGEYQVGIIAWGIGCGREGIPGVYTNVAHYRHWIGSKISSHTN